DNRVRSVIAGTIDTFVGTGVPGGWSHIYGETPTTAWLSDPVGLAWDTQFDTLYVTDDGTHQLYHVTPAMGIQVAAGDGISGNEGVTGSVATRFNGPAGVAVDNSNGTVYVADPGDNKIFGFAFGSVPFEFAGTGASEFLNATPRTAARISDMGSMAKL